MTEPPEADIQYTDEPPHSPVILEEAVLAAAFGARIRELKAADDRAEENKKRWGTLAAFAFGGAIVAFILGGPLEVPYAILGVPAGLVLAIVCLVVRGRLGRADVDDRKVHVLTRLAETLAPELHAKREVSLWADFRGYDKATPVTDDVSGGTGKRTFERPWLRLGLTLLDGSAVRLEVTCKVKRKQKAKRKYTKMRDTIVEEVQLTLTPPKGQQLDPSAVARARQAVAAGPMTLAGLAVKPRQAVLRFRCAPAARVLGRMGWDGRNLRHLFDGDKALYAVLVSYRAMAAAKQRVA